MRYIADYSVGRWLLVNTTDASAKWYTAIKQKTQNKWGR